jgi:hypothetical protein
LILSYSAWTFILGPKFSAKERKRVKPSRICHQPGRILLEHHIQRNFLIHKLFERSCELGLWLWFLIWEACLSRGLTA